MYCFSLLLNKPCVPLTLCVWALTPFPTFLYSSVDRNRMISISTLSCYSALSSRILTTNHLITFLTLHSRYPVLQSINTFYSLIGAVYVFRLCALFCPRISSPSLSLNLPHVLSISRNCHAPESLHRAFIPQCI